MSTNTHTHWDEYTSKYLPGDLVRSRYGLGIIREHRETQGNSFYALWPVPPDDWRPAYEGRDDGINYFPTKSAWYGPEELTLVSEGFASILRREHRGTTPTS